MKKPKLTIFIFIIIISSLIIFPLFSKENKKTDDIKIMHYGCNLNPILSCKSTKEGIDLHLEICNKFEYPIALPFYTISIFHNYGEPSVRGKSFVIKDNSSQDLPYCYTTAKIAIGSATIEDCIILQPNECYSENMKDFQKCILFDQIDDDFKYITIKYHSFLGESNEIKIYKSEMKF